MANFDKLINSLNECLYTICMDMFEGTYELIINSPYLKTSAGNDIRRIMDIRSEISDTIHDFIHRETFEHPTIVELIVIKLSLGKLIVDVLNQWGVYKIIELLSSKDTVETAIWQTYSFNRVIELFNDFDVFSEYSLAEKIPSLKKEFQFLQDFDDSIHGIFDLMTSHSVNVFGNKELPNWMPETSCVYFIHSNFSLLYIGQTSNLKQRLTQHHRKPDFDYLTNLMLPISVDWISVPKTLLLEEEKYWIDKLKPPLNNTPVLSLVSQHI